MSNITPFPVQTIDRVMADDRQFFEGRKGRNLRVRLTSRIEIEGEGVRADLGPPPPGTQWHTIVRQLRPGVRLRATVALPEATKPDDLSETECEELYSRLRFPFRPGTWSDALAKWSDR